MQGEHYGMLCTVRTSDMAHIFYVNQQCWSVSWSSSWCIFIFVTTCCSTVPEQILLYSVL